MQEPDTAGGVNLPKTDRFWWFWLKQKEFRLPWFGNMDYLHKKVAKIPDLLSKIMKCKKTFDIQWRTVHNSREWIRLKLYHFQDFGGTAGFFSPGEKNDTL